MVLEGDLACCERPLEEEPEGQLCQLGLDESTDGLVGEREDLLTLLLPLVILSRSRDRKRNFNTAHVTPEAFVGLLLERLERRRRTQEEFSLYLKASW